jgi:hypothetical protein
VNSTVHKVISTVVAVMTIAICAESFASASKANDNQSIFSIPGNPAVQEGSQNTPHCVPLRNVGIAESAKDYHASCEQGENPKIPLKGPEGK